MFLDLDNYIWVRNLKKSEAFSLVKNDGYHFYNISYGELIEWLVLPFDLVNELNYISRNYDKEYIRTAIVVITTLPELSVEEKMDIIIKYVNINIHHCTNQSNDNDKSNNDLLYIINNYMFINYNYSIDLSIFPLQITPHGYILQCMKNKLTYYFNLPIIGRYLYSKKYKQVKSSIHYFMQNSSIDGYKFITIVCLLNNRYFVIDDHYNNRVYNIKYIYNFKHNTYTIMVWYNRLNSTTKNIIFSYKDDRFNIRSYDGNIIKNDVKEYNNRYIINFIENDISIANLIECCILSYMNTNKYIDIEVEYGYVREVPY